MQNPNSIHSTGLKFTNIEEKMMLELWKMGNTLFMHTLLFYYKKCAKRIRKESSLYPFETATERL